MCNDFISQILQKVDQSGCEIPALGDIQHSIGQGHGQPA